MIIKLINTNRLIFRYRKTLLYFVNKYDLSRLLKVLYLSSKFNFQHEIDIVLWLYQHNFSECKDKICFTNETKELIKFTNNFYRIWKQY